MDEHPTLNQDPRDAVSSCFDQVADLSGLVAISSISAAGVDPGQAAARRVMGRGPVGA